MGSGKVFALCPQLLDIRNQIRMRHSMFTRRRARFARKVVIVQYCWTIYTVQDGSNLRAFHGNDINKPLARPDHMLDTKKAHLPFGHAAREDGM